ncbi:MAG TPA: class I SAM-dependent methyltransferase [Methanoregula sp.]|nr:class I SAM-dependent methyltransferase [Methanoregula sp.]
MKPDPGRENWDDSYRQKGRLYGGATRILPDFPQGARVLELGCGDGKTLSALVPQAGDVTAIDFSPHAVRIARSAPHGAGRIGFAIADAREVPFHDQVFDTVTAIHLLGHSTSEGRSKIVSEILRVTRKGGYVFFADFSTADFRYGNGTETEPGSFVRGNGILTHYFTEPEVASLFSGFTQESLHREEWMLRVRGKEFLRSELIGLFRK